MTQKARLLWSSNAPWANSGYGIQGRSLLWRLANLPVFGSKEAIGIFAWYGLAGAIHTVDGFRCYPSGNDPYGNDVIGRHAKHHGSSIVASLIDVWVCKDVAKSIYPALWIPYLPIDHDPIPQRVLDSLQGAHLPVTYSKWGHDMLTRAGVKNEYVAHGVEPSIYRVLPREPILQFKRQLTGPLPHPPRRSMRIRINLA